MESTKKEKERNTLQYMERSTKEEGQQMGFSWGLFFGWLLNVPETG